MPHSEAHAGCAASRRANGERHRRPDNQTRKPHRAGADEGGLLDALPIAAVVVERLTKGHSPLGSTTRAFTPWSRIPIVQRSDWNNAECLKSGPIADLLIAYFEGSDETGELDFKDGEGVSALFYRINLAPLPAAANSSKRCLLSVVDRTVELQAERTLRAEMLRDSLTGLPNRLAFTEAIEIEGAKVARDLEHAVLVVDMLRFLTNQ